MKTILAGLILATLCSEKVFAEDDGLTAAVEQYARKGDLYAATESKDQWHFMVAPYLWALTTDGSTTVEDNPPAEESNSLIENLEFALMLRADAWYGKWGLSLDFIYANFGRDATMLGAPVTVDWTLGMVELAINRVLVGELKPKDEGQGGFLAAFAGARYTWTELSMDTGAGEAGPVSETWLDPIIGLRATIFMSKHWSFSVRAWAGGFGVASDFTWQVDFNVMYAISEHFGIALGYRWLDIDYVTGEGIDRLGIDVALRGGMLGLVFMF